MSEFQLVLVTAGSEDDAAAIARVLVQEGLAACVNIVPRIRSFYTWEGEVHDDPEVLMLIKTQAARYEALEKRVKELHGYDVPEVIAIPITAGSRDYLDWVRGCTTS